MADTCGSREMASSPHPTLKRFGFSKSSTCMLSGVALLVQILILARIFWLLLSFSHLIELLVPSSFFTKLSFVLA